VFRIKKREKFSKKIENYWNAQSNTKKIIHLLLLGLIMGFFIQELINALFIGRISFFIKSFSSSDILIFWGNIFGGLFGAGVAIFGVYLTMQHSKNENIERDRKSKLPLFVLNRIDINGSKKCIKYFSENEETRKKVILIGKDEIIGRENLFKGDMEELVGEKEINDRYGGIEKIRKKKKFALDAVIELVSLGSGEAINTSIRIKEKDIPIENEKLSKFFPAEHFIIKEKCIIVFFVKDILFEKVDYELIITYEDIYNNNYEQIFLIELFSNNEGRLDMIIDFEIKQKLNFVTK
jgi:hypothetical protein